MRILFLCYRFNSLSQRLYCELAERGHEVSIELDVNPELTIEAVNNYKPDLIIAPFLKRKIPREVWSRVKTLVIHPGPPGDRGPSALDWAILKQEKEWGVSLLEAVDEYDAGPVWSYRIFPMRKARKSSIYRNETTDGAVESVLEIIEQLSEGKEPKKLYPEGIWNPRMDQSYRYVNWSEDPTEEILRKVYARATASSG
jgi:putative two-component system hydrogenase maturation factor HypX/HoxX